MDKHRLLKAVYEAIQWERVYELAPEARREEVDELFREIREHLPPGPDEDQRNRVAGGSALLYCDGASRGNPGPAGVGMVIATPDGREVIAWGEPIGRTTNNVAEYRAAIRGLQEALKLGVRRIRVLSDSQLMVRQIQGTYKVKNAGLKPLHRRMKELLGRFEDWQVEYVRREHNRRADSLASQHARQNSS